MAIIYPETERKYYPGAKSELIAPIVQYLRYEKQASAIASEVPYRMGEVGEDDWNLLFVADILTIVNYELCEIEIKKSLSDFKNDFKKNRFGNSKHDLISKGEGPHKFAFAIPANAGWADRAENYLKENYPKYGLLEVLRNNARSVRSMRLLRDNRPHPLLPLDKQAAKSLSVSFRSLAKRLPGLQVNTVASLCRKIIKLETKIEEEGENEY